LHPDPHIIPHRVKKWEPLHGGDGPESLVPYLHTVESVIYEKYVDGTLSGTTYRLDDPTFSSVMEYDADDESNGLIGGRIRYSRKRKLLKTLRPNKYPKKYKKTYKQV
jgi:hypothetical protein